MSARTHTNAQTLIKKKIFSLRYLNSKTDNFYFYSFVCVFSSTFYVEYSPIVRITSMKKKVQLLPIRFELWSRLIILQECRIHRFSHGKEENTRPTFVGKDLFLSDLTLLSLTLKERLSKNVMT